MRRRGLLMHSWDSARLASDLVDHVYAAAFGEAPWQAFMERSRELLPNGRTVLFHHDRTSCCGAFSLSGGLGQAEVDQYNRRYHAINPWMDHAMLRPLGRVMQADEMLPRPALLRSDFYAEYLRPQDVVTGLGVTLSRDEDRHFFFSIVGRDVEQDRVEDARRTISLIVPHLARAFRTSRTHAAGDEPPCGTLRIDGRMRVVAADGQALALLHEAEDLAIGPFGRLACADSEILRVIQLMLRAEGGGAGQPAVCHRHLRRRGGALPLRACIYRPGAAGGAYASATDCFIHLECPASWLREGARRFVRMHHLSTAEDWIVRRLAEGVKLEQIAAERRTSPDTVRTQLKNIFRKTGCSGQGDILRHIAVLSGGA